MFPGCAAIFFWSSLICELSELPLLPLKRLLKTSPMPVEPDPTPSTTKPAAKTTASRT